MTGVISRLGAIVLMLFAGLAHAQEFPSRQPVKIVVAANAGGGTDVLARITADFLQRRLGQAVVVENRPGASSTIGADFVAKAAADGYTLYFTASEVAVIPAVRDDLTYKFENFTYLIRGFRVPPLMFGSPKLPVNTIKELVDYMKANPGKVRYGSTGVGAVVHLALAMFEASAGVKGVHVPYTGIAPVYQDMLGGNIEITQATLPIPDGIKVLGSVGEKRSDAFPNMPTMDEAGVKGATWDLWFGMLAPPNLPRPVADRLTTELAAIFKDPEAIAKYQSAAKFAPDPTPLIGEAFKARVLEEHRGWKTVAEREKISLK